MNSSKRDANGFGGTQTITALVTGAHHPTGLGSARALRAAGARVIGFSECADSPSFRSRAWSDIRTLSARSPRAVAEEIVSFAESLDGPIFLLPTEDLLAQEFSRIQNEFPEQLRASLPALETVELLLNKTQFASWASERDFPIPKTVILNSDEALVEAIEDFPFPAILKPLVRTAEWQKNSPLQKALLLEGPGDIKSLSFPLFSAAPAYVLSEWIAGADSDVHYCLSFLDSESEMVASFTGRKLLQFPRLTGSTAVCGDTDDPGLTALTAELFKAAGCTGLASLEVKRSAQDGGYFITEPTVGRPNLQSPSAMLSGVNLVGIAMRHAWGRDFSDLVAPRRSCMWFEEQAVFQILISRSRVPISRRLIASQALRSRRFAGAYLALSDPAPFLGVLGIWLRQAWRWVRRRSDLSK